MKDGDEGAGVLLVRVWLHDGDVVARIHSWSAGQPEQQADVVVGAGALTRRLCDWVSGLREVTGRAEAPATPQGQTPVGITEQPPR